MKKIIFIFAIILTVVSITSCTKTPEQEVEKQFYDYVKNNFDNPDDLDEVVSVEKENVVSKDSILSMFNNYKTLYNKVDTIITRTTDNIINKANNIPDRMKNDIRDKTMELANIRCVDHSPSNRITDKLESAINDLDSVTFITYKIKYRIKKNGEKQIREMFAVKQGTKIDFKSVNSIKNYGDDFYNVLISLSYAMDKTNEEFEKVNQLINDYAKWGYNIK